MKVLLNIIFYVLGVGLPVVIVLVAILKKSKNKRRNVLNKVLIAVIIFLIFYIVKVGGISLMNKIDSNKEIKTSLVNKDKTSNTKSTASTSTIETTTTSTSTTIKKNTTNVTTTKANDTTVSSTKGLKIVDGILIVNKSYPLPKDYVPTNTYKDATGLNYCTTCIDNEAYEKYKEMKADATALGLNIWIQSGYRSYNLQESLYNKYVDRDGKVAADTYSARPGYSEHQTGLAFDLNSISDDFQYTEEGKWVNNNCYKYGYILRYPKGKENITGYKYESWHLRYVGVELASKLYNNGDWITLEEHFNLTSTYSD